MLFWKEVLRKFPNKKVICLPNNRWKRVRNEIFLSLLPLSPNGEITHTTEKERVIREGWLPFIEQVDNLDIVAFVPEIKTFLRTGKIPPRMYGSNYGLRLSISYYDRCLEKLDLKRKKISENMKRQVRRDRWKSR